ncbi:MAG: succinylglutamate desuccinylase/aspartoacylase family protein [Flavobacteriaceae bacterium]
MVDVFSKAIKKSVSINRILFKIKGEKNKGSTVVFFAGIHGNEPAGIFALEAVLGKLNHKNVKGNIYAISGNLKAIKEGKRYINKDLNRLWTQKDIDSLLQSHSLVSEHQEQLEIYNLIHEILSDNQGPFYFIDLHTTSSKTLPFITINDAIINRKFSEQFPVPIVLGIEEYLQGPLLSYINTLGYVSLGFESGQHNSKSSISNSIAFINLVLKQTNIVSNIDNNEHFKTLKKSAYNVDSFFEIAYLHRIEDSDNFDMLPAFKSFERIKKGELIAKHNNKEITATHTGRIFMPLYQKSGNEGFFIIKKTPKFFLKLSFFLRHIKADRLFVMMPGISWHSKEKGVLKVNLKIAKYYAKSVFHLLGYRSREIDQNQLFVINREHVSKTKDYVKEPWF